MGKNFRYGILISPDKIQWLIEIQMSWTLLATEIRKQLRSGWCNVFSPFKCFILPEGEKECRSKFWILSLALFEESRCTGTGKWKPKTSLYFFHLNSVMCQMMGETWNHRVDKRPIWETLVYWPTFGYYHLKNDINLFV